MRNYLWVVEEKEFWGWHAWPTQVRSTRARVRRLAKDMRESDSDIKTRVRKYVRVEIDRTKKVCDCPDVPVCPGCPDCLPT